MTDRTRTTLVALNAGLLLALGAVTFAPEAEAQSRTQRARGSYSMVGGEIKTGNANAVWIIDAANQEMICIRWNLSRSEFDGIGYRDLDTDATAQPTR